MYFEGEVPAITYGNGYNNNGFGNGWEGLIGLALVASLFGGWGGFGFGGRGGSYGASPATQADLAAGFANKTEDDSWKTQIVEPYDRTLGGSVQNQMLKGEMSENEWAYIEYDLLSYQNLSAETINEKALAVILMEFADATLSTSIKIRAISVI